MGTEVAATQMRGIRAFQDSPDNQALAADLGVKQSLELDNEGLFTAASHAFEGAALSLVQAGVMFRALRDRMEHGDYLPFLGAHGFDARRAQEAVRAADFVAMLPKSERERMLKAQTSKLVLLSKFSPNEVAEFVKSGELTVLVKMSFSELREWQQERRREHITARLLRSGELKTLPKSTYRGEPIALTTLRDEVIGTLLRARIEVELAQQAFELLADDLPEPAASDVLHFAASELASISTLATTLRNHCKASTDRNVFAPIGELETIKSKYLDDASHFALSAANASMSGRAKARQGAMGKNGRPPSTMEALIKQVQKQTQDDEG